MKKFIFCLLIIIIPSLSWSTLSDLGGGLIYDDVLELTWLQDANYIYTSEWSERLPNYNMVGQVEWDTAIIWADELDYGGYTDWRLPTKEEIEDTQDVNGKRYFQNALFTNVHNFGYWTSTQSDYGDEYKWYFMVPTGVLDITITDAARGAWLVRGVFASIKKIEWVEGTNLLLMAGTELEWVD